MIQCCGYIRVSGAYQAAEGFGLEYQEKAIREYVSGQGWHLTRIYIDAGVSGARESRPALDEMLCNLSGLQYVVVLTLDRLWRESLYVRARVQGAIEEQGADIRSLDQPDFSIYEDDPSRKLINAMLAELADFQRRELVRKLARGRQTKARNGGWCGGGVPIGYRWDRESGRLEVIPEEAAAVRRAFALRRTRNGKRLGFHSVARRLNEEGFTVKGKPFTAMQIKRLEDRKAFYQGKTLYGAISGPGQHEGILA